MKTVFKEKEHLGMDWPILSLFCFKILSLTSTMLLLLSVRCYCFKGLGKANIRSAQKISLGLCSSSSLLVMGLFSRAYNLGHGCCAKNTEKNETGMGSHGPGLCVYLSRRMDSLSTWVR